MTSTTFTDTTGSTPGTTIVDDWLNDVDFLTYEIFTTLSTTVPVVAGAFTFSNSTASTSGSTGAIHTAGGIGAVKDIVTDATFLPLGDTTTGDAAAVGYTAVEGLILTGQGSTGDITIKNDADAVAAYIPTGTTNLAIVGNIELGHATDTTLSRSAAGKLAVEGIDVMSIVGICQGRLTLTSGTAVTTADVSAAGTIYFTPFKGNRVGLYTGSQWIEHTLTELSIAASTSANNVFDIFLDYNGGTPVLAKTDWTNDTTRATALTTQDGVLVQTGNLDWRYLGTARTKTASQVDDASAFRHLWNYYNRVRKDMQVLEGTDSWTYTTATWRQANGSTANQLDFVIGVSEDVVTARAAVTASNSSANITAFVGVSLDATNVRGQGINVANSTAINANMSPCAFYSDQIAVGRHYLAWVEYSTATGTCTWNGDAGTTYLQSGIQGEILC